MYEKPTARNRGKNKIEIKKTTSSNEKVIQYAFDGLRRKITHVFKVV